MPLQPVLLPRQRPLFSPQRGTPGGFVNVVVACDPAIDGDTITLEPNGLTQFSNQYYDHLVLGFIADADPTAGPLFIVVNDLEAKPLYLGTSPADESKVAEGDYCQVAYDSAIGADGGFYLINWTQVAFSLGLTTNGTSGPATLVDGILNIPEYSSSAGGNTRIYTTAGPFTAAADDGAIVLNKAIASPTTINLGPIAARNGLPLTISDAAPNGGNAGDITLTPSGAETCPVPLMGNGGVVTLVPNVTLGGWYVS